MDQQPNNEITILRADIDKVMEEGLASLLGTTTIALKRKREKGVIPHGVYAKIDGRIMYSIRRYDAWVESQWPLGLPELTTTTEQSASALCGTVAGKARQSTTRKPRKASRPPGTSVLT